MGKASDPGPSSSDEGRGAMGRLNVFLRAPLTGRPSRCVQVDDGMLLPAFWAEVAVPAFRGWGISPAGLKLMCRGRTLELVPNRTLRDAGVTALSTLDAAISLPSQGYSRLHQLMEHLLETLSPASSTGSAQPAVEDSSVVLTSREPVMHAIDMEITAAKQLKAPGPDEPQQCCCLSCTGRPNSTLWLCGALMHSTDAAVVNIAFRVVQLLLHARPDCPEPPICFSEQAGALMLTGDEKRFGWLYSAVHDALTPEGVAIASLLSQRQVATPRPSYRFH
jgi:hypothetical protein